MKKMTTFGILAAIMLLLGTIAVPTFEVLGKITPPPGVTKIRFLCIALNTLSDFSIVPAQVNGGNDVTGFVKLSNPSPPRDSANVKYIRCNTWKTVTLTSSDSSVTVPSSISAGWSMNQFTIHTKGVGQAKTVSITASMDGQVRTATLRLLPAPLLYVSLSPSNIVGGNDSTGNVRLDGQAGPSGAIISLSSGNANLASVPSSVTIPAYERVKTFPVETHGVGEPISVTIKASYLANIKTSTLTVTPASLEQLGVYCPTPFGWIWGTSCEGLRLDQGSITLTFKVYLNGEAPHHGGTVAIGLNSPINTGVAFWPPYPENGSWFVTIPEGQRDATFKLTFYPCALLGSMTWQDCDGNILATYKGVQDSVHITITTFWQP